MASLSTSITINEKATGKHAVVLGAGVIGLTSAWALLDNGYKVTIVSQAWASEAGSNISSEAAGALWKCLPLECGPQAVTANLRTNQQWGLESFKLFSALAADPTFRKVIELKTCTILTTGPIEGNRVLSQKLEFVRENLPGFRHDETLFANYGINQGHAGGLIEAYEYLAPVINVNEALTSLTQLVQKKGALLETATINGDLLNQERQLLDKYGADIIVNAMGLGAGEAAADVGVYGLHGALLRLINDGGDFPEIKNTMIVSTTKPGETGGDGAFILPRQDGIVVLGTISTPVGESTDLTVESDAVREMRARCEDLLPGLKNARLAADHPIIQGTRPQRVGGPRVGREGRSASSRIIHNYGHGGAGWSLSIGSAHETVRLANKVVSSLAEAQASTCRAVTTHIEAEQRVHA